MPPIRVSRNPAKGTLHLETTGLLPAGKLVIFEPPFELMVALDYDNWLQPGLGGAAALKHLR
jgi:hypothetical protein